MQILNITLLSILLLSSFCPSQQAINSLNDGLQASYTVAAVNSGYPVTYSSRRNDAAYQTWDVYQIDNQQSAWSPSAADNSCWIQVSTGYQKSWTSVDIQGRNKNGQNFKITTFKVDSTNDGVTYTPVDGGKVFTYDAADPNIKKNFAFSAPVLARSLRIVPQTFIGQIAVRFEAYYTEQN